MTTQTILGGYMQLNTLGKIQQRITVLYPKAAPLYEIYNHLIYPYLKLHQIKIEISIALSRPLQCVKVKGVLLLVHNFPLFNILKSADTSPELLTREIFIIEISDDLFRFELAFYELIEMISRYHKVVDLEQIYNNLNKLLDPDMRQKLFGKNELTVAKFCRLINVPERTYYNHARADQ